MTTATSGVLLSGSILAIAPGAQANSVANTSVPASVSSPTHRADWGDDCDDSGDGDWCDGDGDGDGYDHWGDDQGPGRRRGQQHNPGHGHRTQGGKHARTSGSRAQAQEIAREMIPNDAQYGCFSNVIKRESDWNPRAGNREGAYGLPQALPGRKMASAGSDWRTNPRTQIRWAIGYMDDRYGSPCGAWAHWRRHHSY